MLRVLCRGQERRLIGYSLPEIARPQIAYARESVPNLLRQRDILQLRRVSLHLRAHAGSRRGLRGATRERHAAVKDAAHVRPGLAQVEIAKVRLAVNSHCTGSHSLLSERLARNRCLKHEIGRAGNLLDAAMPEYLLPIAGTLEAGSVFSWPFRLSITQSQATAKRQGKYFSDLEPRINQYCQRLSPGASLLFFLCQLRQPCIGRRIQVRARGLRASEKPRSDRPFPLREEGTGPHPRRGRDEKKAFVSTIISSRPTVRAASGGPCSTWSG